MNRRDAFRTLGLGGLGLLVPWQLNADPMPGQAVTGPLRLGSNENPYGPSPAALEAMSRYMREGNRYPFAMNKDLIQAIARRNGVSDKQVLLGAGSSELLLNAASWAIEAKLPVVAADPVFPIFGKYVERFGGQVTHVPLNALKAHDLPRMQKAAASTPGMVYLVNPNNPTGTLLDHQALLDFIKTVSKKSYVLVDEAYIEFVDPAYSRSVVSEVTSNPKLIVLRTFSKVHGLAGMRIGYALAHPDTLKKFSSYQIWPNASVNAAAIGAALACLEDKGFVNETIEKNTVAKQHVYDTLDQMKIPYIPSHTNFMIFDLKKYKGQFKQDMAKENILLQEVQDKDGLWARLSIGKLEEMSVFTQKLQGIWKE
jgi:histidinol-phosphate aminotransferase